MVLVSSNQTNNTFPLLKVVPWNGHPGAVSLTFDDGDPSHLDVAIPKLNRRQLCGSFSLIANRTERDEQWGQAVKSGHEILNHTLDHLHANTLTPQGEKDQVVGAQNLLQKKFGISLYSFVYPFSEISPGLRSWVEKTSFIARGGIPGLVSPKDKAIDWFNIPVKTAMSNYPIETYQSWIDEARQKGNWLVFVIHGIEGTPWGWQPITREIFEQILDDLRSKDVWVGTFSQVGGYLRAWQSFEAATVQTSGQETVYQWVVPEHCPPNVRLKVCFPHGNPPVQVWQKEELVAPDAQGNYDIFFNEGQLSLRR
jgi:peptidoglycan/xylan/chitin deacetylase (PgdA/CDA1 family)